MDMANALNEEKQQQVLSLGRLGLSQRQTRILSYAQVNESKGQVTP